ncbi:MAG: hypothetical protein JNM17_26745 [Archangium sp.]|nr:hypothetical protein [Archangium sp.]
MRFEATHLFQGTIAEVEQSFLDARYLDFVIKHHGVLLEAQMLESKSDGALIKRRVRYRPRPVIESIGGNKIPPEWFAFVEESTWDPAKHELVFKNTPTSAQIASMLINTGTLRFRDVGGRCERRMEGEISIKVPFFLKPLALIAEAVIHKEGLEILDAEVKVMDRFLAEVLRGTGPAKP